jgi:hypothetical protein
MNFTEIFVAYCAVNTLHLGYRKANHLMPCREIIDVVKSNHNENASSREKLVFLNINRGDTLSNHCDLECEALI